MHSPFAVKTNVSFWKDLLLLSLGILFVFLIFLGSRPLSTPDEGRYAEIPREMLVSKDFITPHIDGIKYFEKPPLFYWIQTSTIGLLGPTIWAARLPNALLAWLGCLLLYVIGRYVFDRRTGLLASIILASTSLYFVFARMVTLDLGLSIWMLGTWGMFLLALEKPLGTPRRLLLYGAYLFAGLAVLTKGLIGIIFPSAVLFFWMICQCDWTILKKLYLPTGLLIFLAVVLPWHIAVQIRNPEFFHFYFIEQQFLRYSTLSAMRYQPPWFFIAVGFLGLFPWVVFLPSTLKEVWPTNRSLIKEKKVSTFLLLWIGFIFFFFSFSYSKLIPYLLPIFPAIALLIGRFFSLYWENIPKKTFGTAYFILFFLILLLLPTFLYAQKRYGIPHQALVFMGFAVGTFILSALLALERLYRKRTLLFSFSLTALGSIVGLLFCFLALPYIDQRSVKPFAVYLTSMLQPGDKIFTFNNYFQDLPYYLQKKIGIVNNFGELTFGMQHQSSQNLLINEGEFWPQWESRERIFMVIDKDQYMTIRNKHTFFLLKETPQTLLLTNHSGNYP